MSSFQAAVHGDRSSRAKENIGEQPRVGAQTCAGCPGPSASPLAPVTSTWALRPAGPLVRLPRGHPAQLCACVAPGCANQNVGVPLAPSFMPARPGIAGGERLDCRRGSAARPPRDSSLAALIAFPASCSDALHADGGARALLGPSGIFFSVSTRVRLPGTFRARSRWIYFSSIILLIN